MTHSNVCTYLDQYNEAVRAIAGFEANMRVGCHRIDNTAIELRLQRQIADRLRRYLR